MTEIKTKNNESIKVKIAELFMDIEDRYIFKSVTLDKAAFEKLCSEADDIYIRDEKGEYHLAESNFQSENYRIFFKVKKEDHRWYTGHMYIDKISEDAYELKSMIFRKKRVFDCGNKKNGKESLLITDISEPKLKI